MRTILAILALTLVGCSTVPVKVPFPEAPKELMASPKPLQTLNEDGKVSLSELLGVVINNYGSCNENTIKYTAWQEWYKTQRKAYEDANVTK